MPETELYALVSEGRAALAAPIHARVSACFEVLPKIVDALERTALYQTELRQVRKELTEAVEEFRTQVYDAQKLHPGVTFNNAHIRASLRKVTEILSKLDRLMFRTEANP